MSRTRPGAASGAGSLLLLGLGACGREQPTCPDGRTGDAENVLIIVSDDVGIDKTGTYGEHENAPSTPNIDALAADGLLFRNAYACPTCSPSRAALLTGRLPSRTGIGRWIYPSTETADLRFSELTLPEMLNSSPACYSTAWVGKWHVVRFGRTDAQNHPGNQGFERYAGSLGNPLDAVQSGNLPRGYTNWEKVSDGEPEWSESYMATDTTDEALAFMRDAPQPWLLVVAYNLAHVPVHVPPGDLNVGGVTEASTDLEKMRAMVMAMDAELGRLMAGLPEAARDRTNVFYMTDNGTAGDFVEPPWNPSRAKGTTYDGGVRVPLIVAGPRVSTPGMETDALVHLVDLFPTVAEIAGVDVQDLQVEEGVSAGAPVVLDGVSLLGLLEDPDGPPPRDTVYTEAFYPNGDVIHSWHSRMLRDAGWKLTRNEERGALVSEHLYRYDPGAIDEGYDLLDGALGAEDQEAFERLGVQLDELTAELSYGY